MTNLKYITPEFYHRWLEDCPVKWERIDDDIFTQTIKFTLPIEEEKVTISDSDYADNVDRLVENMEST